MTPHPATIIAPGQVVMADRVYSLVKGPAGWVLIPTARDLAASMERKKQRLRQ